MKRKVIPFPSSSVCSMPKSKTAFPTAAPMISESTVDAITAPVSLLAPDLILPHSHEHSLKLLSIEALNALEQNPPEGLEYFNVLSPGLIELIIRSGKIDGYGARSWPFRVGGVGLIFDDFSSPLSSV